MSSPRQSLGVVLTLGLVLTAVSAQAQYRMTGSLDLNAGASLIRNLTADTIVPNTNNGASLMIPARAFALTGTKFQVFPTIPNVVQVFSSFTSSNVAETLMAGAGPSAFSFCPRNNFGCTNQTNPGGDPGFKGLLEYRTGNGFGGTFRVLRNISAGAVSRIAGTDPLQVNHQPSTDPDPWAGGLTFQATQDNAPVPQGILSSPVALGPSGSIQTPGPTIPNGGLFQPTAFETGFPATTGSIFLQDSIGFGQATFTMVGSDNRDASGNGSITLVASGYSNNLAAEVFPLRLTLTMVLPEPATGLGVAAGMLTIVGLAYARRRRL